MRDEHNGISNRWSYLHNRRLYWRVLSGATGLIRIQKEEQKMNWQLLKTNRPLLLLVIISFAIFPSIFMGAKVMGLVFLAYVLVIGWNLTNMLGFDILSQLSDASDKRAKESKDEGKIVRAGVYFAAFPAVILGIAMIFILIFCMLFLL